MSQLFYLPFRPVFNSRGLPSGGAKVYFYLTGTTTLATVYADGALTTPLTNPVPADALGQLPDIYMPDDVIYRVRIVDRKGLPLGSDIDPYYPGQAVAIVPSLPELLAPGGAGLIGYQAPFTSSVVRTQADRNVDQLNVFDFIPVALHAAILGRTVNNNIAQGKQLATFIQNAIDAAALQRRRLHFPAGLYNIAPREGFAAEGGTCQRCFAIRSYMDIYGETGATLRIVNGVSTDAAVVFMCMFGTNEQLANVSWRGLEMDMNGQNNPISPNRASGVYTLVNQAMIFVTGTPGGQAARINGAKIIECTFRNTPGVSCVVMGQSNVVGSGVGRGWLVYGCKFIDGGLDTIDHSAVYAWAEDVTGLLNLFENALQFDKTGGLVAWEVHGTNQKFGFNTVRRFYQGMWIDGNATNVTRNTQVFSNLFDLMGAFGVMFFGRIEAEESVVDTRISSNDISFDLNALGAEDLKIGIGCTGPYSQVGAEILFNRIRGGGTSSALASAGVVLAAGNVIGQKHDRFTIAGNLFELTSVGISLATNNSVGLGSIIIRNNDSVSLSVAGIVTIPQGITFNGGTSRIDSLTLENNHCIDDRSGAQCAFGIRLQGSVGNFTSTGNTARGMTAADYAEVAFAALSRKGRFLTSLPYNLPSLAAGASTFADISVPNAELGDDVSGFMNIDLGEVETFTKVVSPGMARMRFRNFGASASSGSNGSINVALVK